MRILILSQYFWPESFPINDIARQLECDGHQITVATGKPNYPDGKIFEGYSEKNTQHEVYSRSIDVYRVPLTPRGGGSATEIARNYASFVFSGVRWFPKLLSDRKFDVIFVYAPSPITMAIPAIYLKFRTKSHLAVWIQDLWPESLSATGYVNNSFLVWCVGLLVRAIYSLSDTLLVQSRGFVESVSRYARPDKIIYYPNSCRDQLLPVGESQAPEDLLELLDKNFCVVFAGNLGSAQSLETLVDACLKLRSLPGFRMVVIGSGHMSSWLEEQKNVHNLDNLVIAGRYPVETMPSVFSRASALLVSLKKSEIFSKTIPSKIQAYMSAGRPIIASLDGEGARIIVEAGAGLTSDAEDVGGLVENIKRIYGMDEAERGAIGKSAREYFLKNFEIKCQVSRLVQLFEERLKLG